MNKPVTPTINKLKVNQILCNFSKIKKKKLGLHSFMYHAFVVLLLLNSTNST